MPEFRFDRQRFDAIVANGGGGDDVHADSALDRLSVNGLDGDDTITATPRAQTMTLLDLVP